MGISFLLMKSCQLCVVLHTREVTRSDLFLTLGMFLRQPTTCCRSWKQWYGSLFQELLHTLLRTCLSTKVIIHSITYSISYDVCHGLGSTTVNHNRVGGSVLPMPSVVPWQSCENFLFRLVRKVHCWLIFHVNQKKRERAPWRTWNTWPTLGISVEYHMIRPDLCRKADG